MDNQSQNLIFDGEHPPREHFLMFIDGELPAKEAQKWESHLAACWECRVQVGKLDGTIADIIEFENVVMKGYVSNNLGDTADFNSKLKQLAQKNQKPSFRSKLSAFWFHTRIGQFAMASLAFLLTFVLIFQLFPKTVSASELLNKSNASLSQKILSVSKPVLYQQIKISTQGKSAILEVWNDVDGKRAKRKAAEDEQTKEVLSQFETVLTGNDLNILNPLSAEVYQTWSNQFAQKQESVTNAKTEKNEGAFQLSTKIAGNREIGKITQANLIFRESDWHPVNGTISVKTVEGNQVFEITELKFRIIRGVSLKEDFFEQNGNQK